MVSCPFTSVQSLTVGRKESKFQRRISQVLDKSINLSGNYLETTVASCETYKKKEVVLCTEQMNHLVLLQHQKLSLSGTARMCETVCQVCTELWKWVSAKSIGENESLYQSSFMSQLIYISVLIGLSDAGTAAALLNYLHYGNHGQSRTVIVFVESSWEEAVVKKKFTTRYTWQLSLRYFSSMSSFTDWKISSFLWSLRPHRYGFVSPCTTTDYIITRDKDTKS